MEPAG